MIATAPAGTAAGPPVAFHWILGRRSDLDPAALGLGEQLFAAAIVGFALQHYDLDAKIWRVRRDRDVQRHLQV
ncbi:MAG: hypothetical protein ACRD26_20185 [Vicinamibacterales bacterium]